MKKKILAISFFIVLCGIFLFFILGKDSGPGPEAVFNFEKLEDGTYSVGIQHGIADNYKIKTAVIPSTYNGQPVTHIQTNAFSSCKKLETVDIPSTIKTIGDWAFCDCVKLEKIALPEGLKTVGNKIFFGCTALKEVSIPNSIEEGATNLFSTDDFNRLKKLDKKNGVVYVGNETNPYLIAVKVSDKDTVNVTLESSCKFIHDGAFSNCQSLKTISIPNGVKELGSWVFNGCNQLTEITLPNSVVTVGESTFYNCTNLKDIALSNKLKNISYRMFYNCSSLQSITIPASVDLIDKEAFENCTNLSDARFESNCNWRFDIEGGVSFEVLKNPSKAANYLKTQYVNRYWTAIIEKNEQN